MSCRAPIMTCTCGMLLRAASILVPRGERREWLAEWRGELHYVLGRNVADWDCIAFSLGALPDAFWIGRHSLRCRRRPQLESPAECLMFIAILTVASISLIMLVPQVRLQIFPPAYDGPPDVVTLGLHSAAEYVGWSAHAHAGLSQIAFYEPVSAKAKIGAQVETWQLGRTSTRLAGLLNFRILEPQIAACRRAGATPIVLSRGAAMRFFSGDSNAVGRVLRVDGHQAMIVGIAPEMNSGLPTREDAWSIEPEEAIRRLAFKPFAYGYMVARLAPISPDGTGGITQVELTSNLGVRTWLYVTRLSSIAQDDRNEPEINFLLTLAVVCLALPAILAVSLRTGLKTERVSSAMRAKGWAFLAAKIVLLLPVLFCEPLLVAAIFGLPVSGSVLDFCITFGVYLFAALWVINDQRQRCPRCLRRLTSPARVGERSRSFLDFSGIEYACADGHGLLHVPDFPTSWFDGQRWLALDPSWSSLFRHGIA